MARESISSLKGGHVADCSRSLTGDLHKARVEVLDGFPVIVQAEVFQKRIVAPSPSSAPCWSPSRQCVPRTTRDDRAWSPDPSIDGTQSTVTAVIRSVCVIHKMCHLSTADPQHLVVFGLTADRARRTFDGPWDTYRSPRRCPGSSPREVSQTKKTATLREQDDRLNLNPGEEARVPRSLATRRYRLLRS